MAYDQNGNWYDETSVAGAPGQYQPITQVGTQGDLGDYIQPVQAGIAAPPAGTGGFDWQGAGGALSGAVGALGTLQQQQNAANAVGSATGAQLSGIQEGLGSIQGLYGQTSGLNLPFIQAGAGVGNAIQANTNPYIGAGQQAIGDLQGLQSPINQNQFLDPSAAFALKQGMDAAQRSQAARGGLLSGAAMKDLTGYASGLASQNYQQSVQNAFQNRQQQAGIGNQLYQGGLSGVQLQTPVFQGGVNALQFQNQLAGNTGNQTTQLYQNLGTVRGQGALAGAQGPSSLQQAGQYIDAAGKLIDIGSEVDWGGVADTIGGWISAEATKTDVRPVRSAGDLMQYGGGLRQTPAQQQLAATMQGLIDRRAAAGQPQMQNPFAQAGQAVDRAMRPQAPNQFAQAGQQAWQAAQQPGATPNAMDVMRSFFSSEDAKEGARPLTEAEVNRSLDGMKAKSYEYKQSAQRELGVPPGRRAGVMAEDVRRTPAGGMVRDTDPLSIDIPKAVSFSLAATAALNKRLSALEKGGK